MTRLRLVAVEVTPRFVLDDGENVVPGPAVQPQVVSSVDWPQVLSLVAEATTHLQAQLDAQAGDSPEKVD